MKNNTLSAIFLGTLVCSSAFAMPKTTSKINTFAPSTMPGKPAPPLTKVYVYSVTSTACGTEMIDEYAMATTCDHGGEELRVNATYTHLYIL